MNTLRKRLVKMIDKLAIGDKCYLTKYCGGLTLVEIISKTDSHIIVNFIIDSKIRRVPNEIFNKRFSGKSATYKDKYDVMAENNKYLTSAKVLRDYYNKRDYINTNRQP